VSLESKYETSDPNLESLGIMPILGESTSSDRKYDWSKIEFEAVSYTL
jgi:hypothetical protein